MENYTMIFNAITLAAGLYCLYVWFKLRKSGKLFDNQLLIPKDNKPTDCVDEASYIKYISIRLLILGAICTVASLLCMADLQYHLLSNLFPQIENFNTKLDQGCNILCMAALIWYMICWTKGRREYWV